MTEKWLFRIILGSVAVMMAAAVLGSLDDIKRYIDMKRM